MAKLFSFMVYSYCLGMSLFTALQKNFILAGRVIFILFLSFSLLLNKIDLALIPIHIFFCLTLFRSYSCVFSQINIIGAICVTKHWVRISYVQENCCFFLSIKQDIFSPVQCIFVSKTVHSSQDTSMNKHWFWGSQQWVTGKESVL